MTKKDNPMTMISIRLSEDMVTELKRIAPLVGESGYQPLIRSYIEQGLAQDIKRTDKAGTINYADEIEKAKESRSPKSLAEPRGEYVIEQRPKIFVDGPTGRDVMMEDKAEKKTWGKDLVAVLKSFDKTGWEDVNDAVEWVEEERSKRREEREKRL